MQKIKPTKKIKTMTIYNINKKVIFNCHLKIEEYHQKNIFCLLYVLYSVVCTYEALLFRKITFIYA